MCKILVIYHSQSGNTGKMAEGVARGELGKTIAAGCEAGIY